MSDAPLHLLCVEPTFPGRLGALADWLVRRRGYRCTFFTHTVSPATHWPNSVNRGLEVVTFNVGGVAREPSVPWFRSLERGLCYAFGAWEVYDAQRTRPIDLILGHSAGVGSTLFAPVSYPGIPLVQLFTYFPASRRGDLAGEMPEDTPPAYFHFRRSAGTMDLLDLENGCVPWIGSGWQCDTFPEVYRDSFHVIPEGVTVLPNRPNRSGVRHLFGRTIPEGYRLVTFVARFADRLRGLDRFLNLARILLRQRSDVVCIVLGNPVGGRALDVTGFGRDLGAEWLAEHPGVDRERLWFLGELPPNDTLWVLTTSDLHIAPSRSYPVARSLLEAMGAGVPVLAWDTPPVREVIDPGRTGLLVADADSAATQALAVLRDPAEHYPLVSAAREVIRERYDRDLTIPQLIRLFAQTRR